MCVATHTGHFTTVQAYKVMYTPYSAATGSSGLLACYLNHCSGMLRLPSAAACLISLKNYPPSEWLIIIHTLSQGFSLEQQTSLEQSYILRQPYAQSPFQGMPVR